MSQETKDKISKALTGKPTWNKGRTNIYSRKTLKKIRVGRIGKKHTKEAKLKIKNYMTGKQHSLGKKNFLGKKHSEESKQKMSLAHTNTQGYWKGKILKLEHKNKISKSVSKTMKELWLKRKLSTTKNFSNIANTFN